jgi:hypothetical protein
MVTTIEKYDLGFSFIICTSHLKGEEIFGSMKQMLDLTLRSKGNSQNMIIWIFFIHDWTWFIVGSKIHVYKSSGIMWGETSILMHERFKV